MEQFYNEELKEIKRVAKGTTIVDIEHNESAPGGMIMTLSTGTKLMMGWSIEGENGYCYPILSGLKEQGGVIVLNK
jgi:hypothetical protein